MIQQNHEVKRFDENAAQKFFLQFYILFSNKIITVSYELQSIEHATRSQREHGVLMMSPTAHRRLIDA